VITNRSAQLVERGLGFGGEVAKLVTDNETAVIRRTRSGALLLQVGDLLLFRFIVGQRRLCGREIRSVSRERVRMEP
jgi:hypothetical protein